MKRLRGVKLLVGSSTEGGVTVADLPRNHQKRALVGDPRNDENIIVSQLQLLFIHFHNKVVDRVLDSRRHAQARPGLRRGADDSCAGTTSGSCARLPAEGRRHDDGATPCCAPGVGRARPTVNLHFFNWKDKPFMPVEFSGAAYRFGHSMVRDNYVLNDGPAAVSVFDPGPGRSSETLIGRRELPPALEIDWKTFFATRRRCRTEAC